MNRKAFLCAISLLCFLNGSARHHKPLGMNLQYYDYPFPVYFMHTEVENEPVRIAYMDVIPSRPNGQVVMLLHGKNFPAAYWKRTIEALTNAGYRVIAPDALGFGKSDKPFVQYSFSLLAYLDRQLLDKLHIDRAAIVGHSMGGMLATRFALDYPEKTSKLVLEDALGLEDWRGKGVSYRPVEEWYGDEQAATYESIKHYHMTSYYPVWREDYGEWIDVQYGMKLDKDRKRLDWVNALTYDMIFTQPVVYEFPHIRVPTLVIVGMEDKTKLARNAPPEVTESLGHYSELGKRTAAAIPGAKLIEYPRVGHVPHLTIPGRFHQDLLQFLGGND